MPKFYIFRKRRYRHENNWFCGKNLVPLCQGLDWIRSLCYGYVMLSKIMLCYGYVMLSKIMLCYGYVMLSKIMSANLVQLQTFDSCSCVYYAHILKPVLSGRNL